MAYCTDCCGNGMGAVVMWGTPLAPLLDLGVKYVGLPDDDYDFYAPLLRPSIPSETLSDDYNGLLSESFVPPSIVAVCDDPHSIRNGRRNLILGDARGKCLVFYTEKGDAAEEAEIWASGLYIKKLADMMRHLKGQFSIAEMVHFNKFMDQRGDAAYELASWRLIKTLERHFPEDKGTILSLIGMNYASSPWRTMCFTNPFVIVEFVWCAVAIWEMQEGFVKNTCQRIDLHCPSNQFRTTQKANACAVTNIILDHYRAKAQFGEQQVWHDLGLTSVN